MSKEDLYDHYKDSFEQQKLYIQKRDKFTIYLLIGVFLFVCVLVNPQKLTDYVNAYTKAKVDGLVFDFAILNSFLLYVMLWIVLQYYQTCLTIEKGYDYLWEMESKLEITREGESYATQYPLLKNVANFFYAWCIPFGVVILSIAKIKAENNIQGCYKCPDILALCVIIIFSVLYFSDRNLDWKYLSQYQHCGIGFCKRMKGFIKLDVKEDCD